MTQAESALHLLHQADYGTLATNSVQVDGYPYATILPFALDEHHQPLFLISRLAEHTRNLLADSRASLLVATPSDGNVQTGARLTVVGDVREITPSEQLVARYLRYQPETQRYLEFGDFAFFRMVPLKLRLIAGFGQAYWIGAATWAEIPVLSLTAEAEALNECAGETGIVGLDRYGADCRGDGKRERRRFADAPVAPGRACAAKRALLAGTRL
jgi:putative heme iron utilization protein